MVLDGKSLQDYPVNGGVSQGSILAPEQFLRMIFWTVTTNVLLLRQKTKQTVIRIKTLKFRLKYSMGMLLQVIFKILHVKK